MVATEVAPCAGHIVVGTNPLGLSAARRHVHSVAKGFFGEDCAMDVLLAVGEAISNAYQHGTSDHRLGLIYIDWCFRDSVFTVSIKDEGSSFSFSSRRNFQANARYRGRGLEIIRRTVDDVRIERDQGTRLVLQKRVTWPLKNSSSTDAALCG